MRVIHGVVLLGAIVAGCTAAGEPKTGGSKTTTTMPADPCSPSPGPAIEVEVKFVLQNQKTGAGTCKMVLPLRAHVCKDTESITWLFYNYCPEEKNLKVLIGPRVATDAAVKDDPLDATPNHPPSSVLVPAPASAGMVGKEQIAANVNKTVIADGCYEYTIGGTHPADPEIEVRRGNGSERTLWCK